MSWTTFLIDKYETLYLENIRLTFSVITFAEATFTVFWFGKANPIEHFINPWFILPIFLFIPIPYFKKKLNIPRTNSMHPPNTKENICLQDSQSVNIKISKLPFPSKKTGGKVLIQRIKRSTWWKGNTLSNFLRIQSPYFWNISLFDNKYLTNKWQRNQKKFIRFRALEQYN